VRLIRWERFGKEGEGYIGDAACVRPYTDSVAVPKIVMIMDYENMELLCHILPFLFAAATYLVLIRLFVVLVLCSSSWLDLLHSQRCVTQHGDRWTRR